MKGLEICKAYYGQYGRPLLEKDFPSLLPLIAAGLTGSGSECFGFDDEVSRDHDFGPDFCLFLPDEDTVSRRDAFLLERACAKLPREFMGLCRPLSGPVGGPRRGVMRLGDFLQEKTGTPDGCLTLSQWMTVPEEALAEAVNGELFWDGCGTFTRIREALRHYPEDVFRKKLAGHLWGMAQAGQYNYPRCLKHGESAAAQLALFEFTQHAAAVIFLLNRQYRPYYKWWFRAMRALPQLNLNAELLEFLITADNSQPLAEEKISAAESVCADIIDVLTEQGLTRAVCQDLEKHAHSVNDSITDGNLRNLHLLAAL